jgi:hypothetical protein
MGCVSPSTVLRRGCLIVAAGALWVSLASCGAVKAAPDVEKAIAKLVKGEKPHLPPRLSAAQKARAAAVISLHERFASSKYHRPACLTIDAVNEVGGADKTPEEKLASFARGQFNDAAKAQEFASNLKKVTRGDVLALAGAYCYGDEVGEAVS